MWILPNPRPKTVPLFTEENGIGGSGFVKRLEEPEVVRRICFSVSWGQVLQSYIVRQISLKTGILSLS